MFPAVNAGRCDLDFEPALHRIFWIAPEEQSTIRLGRGLVLQIDLKIPEFFLGPDDSTGCFRRGKNPFLQSPVFIQANRLGRQKVDLLSGKGKHARHAERDEQKKESGEKEVWFFGFHSGLVNVKPMALSRRIPKTSSTILFRGLNV